MRYTNTLKFILIAIAVFFCLRADAQTYTLNYDSVRLGKTPTSSIFIPKNLWLKGLTTGANGDSVLVIKNGMVKKVLASSLNYIQNGNTAVNQNFNIGTGIGALTRVNILPGATPSAPASGIYTWSPNNLISATMFGNGYNISLSSSLLTGSRLIRYPNNNGTIFTEDGGQTVTNANIGQLVQYQNDIGTVGDSILVKENGEMRTIPANTYQPALTGFINVTDYGVVGDSTTNNTTALRAIFANSKSNGAVIFFPKGRYLLSDSIIVKYPCTIYGGPDSKIYQTNGAHSVFALNSDHVIIKDLKFYNNAVATNGAAITLNKGVETILDNVDVFFFYNSVNVRNGASWKIMNSVFFNPVNINIIVQNLTTADEGDATIFNCTFFAGNSNRAHILQKSGGGLKILNNKFNASSINYPSYAYDGQIVGSTGILLMQNNSVEGFGVSGVRLRVGSGIVFQSPLINNNQFSSFTATPKTFIDIDGAGGSVSIVNVQNNNMYASANTKALIVVNNVTYGTIAGNTANVTNIDSIGNSTNIQFTNVGKFVNKGAINATSFITNGGTNSQFIDGTGALQTIPSSVPYPSAGIPLSTGSSWGASITNNSANWNSAYSWGNHAGLYPTYNGTGATGNWGINITGSATTWNSQAYQNGLNTNQFYALTFDATTSTWRPQDVIGFKSWLGLGSNAYTSTTFAPLASPAFTGSPTAPTQSPLTNNTTLGTTGYTDAAITALKAANNTWSGTNKFTNDLKAVLNAFSSGTYNLVGYNSTTDRFETTVSLPSGTTVSTPTNANEAVNKSYADGLISNNGRTVVSSASTSITIPTLAYAGSEYNLILTGSSLQTVTLPLSISQGARISITGYGTGGWKIAQTLDVIKTTGGTTTTGPTGYVQSTAQYNSIIIECVAATAGAGAATYVVQNVQGSPTFN